MLRRRSKLILLAIALASTPALAKDKLPPEAFAATVPVAPAPLPNNGSIFQGAYVPLTSGGRAGAIGDIVTNAPPRRRAMPQARSATAASA
jgi:flagellar L-ring protein precursor FlgH